MYNLKVKNGNNSRVCSAYERACSVRCVKADVSSFLLMLQPACVCKHACPPIIPVLSVYVCVCMPTILLG